MFSRHKCVLFFFDKLDNRLIETGAELVPHEGGRIDEALLDVDRREVVLPLVRILEVKMVRIVLGTNS